MKNKTTAALLALFLGGIGVHRFYLGQTGIGIVYLLFCWTLIPAVIAFIEFIIFLSMSDAAFDAKYNNTGSPVTVNVANHQNVNVADELEKLHRLKESGALTEEEYNSRKTRLLS